jgi:hypothetical protein
MIHLGQLLDLVMNTRGACRRAAASAVEAAVALFSLNDEQLKRLAVNLRR